MGMFDDIQCHYPLPLPEVQGELAGCNWRENGFQTKDFDCLMDHYRIGEDGRLWLQTYVWDTTRKGRPTRKPAAWQPMSGYTGTIRFYDSIDGSTADYWVEWVAVFVDGELTELKLQCWEECDNRERLAAEARWKAAAEERNRFLATWVGRRVYAAYAWLVHGCFGFPAYRLWQRIGRQCQRAGLWLDRLGDKLAPYGDPVRAEQRRRAFKELFRDDED